MSVNNVGIAEPEFGYRKSGRLGPFRKHAGVRAYDGLPISACAQPSCEREQGFLPSAPCLFRIHVNDGEWPQKNECSTFRYSASILAVVAVKTL